jgi:hypothetical protein
MMKYVDVAFEEYEGDTAKLLPGYQHIKCDMIFEVKMGKNFHRKASMMIITCFVDANHAGDVIDRS